MNLSVENKKFLENILKRTIEFDEESSRSEFYNIKGTIDRMVYDKEEKCYYISDDYIDKFNNCDKIVIITVEICSFGFMFVDDFENITI